METYEALAILSGEMLQAARNAEWHRLLKLEQASRRLVDALPPDREAVTLDVRSHGRRREILMRILAEDAEIRDRVQPWMHEARQFLTSLKIERSILRRRLSDGEAA